MAFQFNVMFPSHLAQLQNDVLSDFNCLNIYTTIRGGYQLVTYSTNYPQDISNVARALLTANPRIFISSVSNQGIVIYYHKSMLQYLDSETLQNYVYVMENLHPQDRVLHDYLVNLYKAVPINKEFM